jgi:aminoglycoside phosphotransferase (APT) family kinase protein
VTVVPAVTDCWIDAELSFAPCVAVERRDGERWSVLEDRASIEEVEQLLQSLGAAIATWHCLDLERLPSEIREPADFQPKAALDRFLAPAELASAVQEVAALSGAPRSWRQRWINSLEPITAMSPVFIHGDVCEGQLLVDAERRVGTVLDWDTAGIGHPLHDFDFGEWGFGIFGWEDDFARLRHAMWSTYADNRAIAGLPNAAQVHLAFTLSELLFHERRYQQRSLDAWATTRRETIRRALGPATEAVQ